MSCRPWISVLLVGLLLGGCSPAFNWRDVRIDDGALVGLLPCKPDTGERTLPLAGAPVLVHMQGCEAEGMMFTMAAARIPAAGNVSAALEAWKAALMANVRAADTQDRSFIPTGATPLPTSVQARFAGRRADGAPIVVQAAFFARGDRVYQAAIFSDKPAGDVAETFFGSLGLR